MCGMKKYPAENWKALGRWIYEARMQGPDDRDMDEWAKRVGRSTRQLRGLERGEPVGAKTLELVADALGIEQWYLFGRLADPDAPNGVFLRPSDIEQMKESHAADAGRAPISALTDQQLIDELSRRLALISKRKEGGDDGTQASTQKTELDRARELKEQRDREEVSAPDETLSPAADRFDPEGDEPPGGSR